MLPDDALYQIVVPKYLKEELSAALQEAAIQNRAVGHYILTDGTVSREPSELQFEPFFTGAAIYVGKLIVSGVTSYFVRVAIECLVKKLRPTSEVSGASAAVDRVVVLLPDGNIEELNAADAAALSKALDRIAKVEEEKASAG